jgi:hypothetical protein
VLFDKSHTTDPYIIEVITNKNFDLRGASAVRTLYHFYVLLSLGTIIIPHLIEFVKGFYKFFWKVLSPRAYHALPPLDNNIISHLQEIVNSQNHQSFVREFVQSAYYTQNGSRRPTANRSEFQVKIKKPRPTKFGLEIVEEVYFAENRRLHDRSRRPNQWKCLITSCAEYPFSSASNFKI